MSSRSVVFALTLAATGALGTGCSSLPTERDPAEIQARYKHKFVGECTSWLRSHRTGYLYCASPAVDYAGMAGDAAPAAPDAPADAPTGGATADGATDLASLVAAGEKVFAQNCQACHGADGAGMPGVFPPLAGAGAFYGDPQNHASIILNGLQGEIEVLGVTYNGVMAPWSQLSDYEIAAVATYERNSWGNDDGIVLPEDVAAARAR